MDEFHSRLPLWSDKQDSNMDTDSSDDMDVTMEQINQKLDEAEANFDLGEVLTSLSSERSLFHDPSMDELSQGNEEASQEDVDMVFSQPGMADSQDVDMERLSQDAENMNLEGDAVNPIIEGGLRMHKFLADLELETCAVCHETWFDLEVSSRTKMCKRCYNDQRNHKGSPAMFSAENRMDPGKQPACLSILNRVEQAAIAIIAPVQNVVKLRGGTSVKQKGHTISFVQDVAGFAQRLPRGQPELPFIIIKAPHQETMLKANRMHILAALEWLQKNNPHYRDIVIDKEVLSTYPDNSDTCLTGVRYIDTVEELTEEDLLDCVNQPDEENLQSDLIEDVAPSVVTADLPKETIRNCIRAKIAQGSQEEGIIPWPKRAAKPASEFQSGFYAMSYPALLPYGNGDMSKDLPVRKPSPLAWLRHLTRYKDGRFARNYGFVLAATSLYRRHMALSIGNVFAGKECEGMAMEEVKRRVGTAGDPLINTLLYWGSTIPGTRQSWKSEGSKAISFERAVRIFSNNERMLNLFCTFSMPSITLPEFHNIIDQLLREDERYVNKTVVKNAADIPASASDASQYITAQENFRRRQRAVQQNCHILDYVANQKLDLLLKHVMEDVLGITHYFSRKEFQSRGTLHWHLTLSMQGLNLADTRAAFKKYKFEIAIPDDVNLEDPQDECDLEWIQIVNSAEDVSPEEKAEIKRARRRVLDFYTYHAGVTEVHPQADPTKWPIYDGGTAGEPDINCLLQDPVEVLTPGVFDAADYERLCNRVQLHNHSPQYCLRFNQALNRQQCRFGFPLQPNMFNIETRKGADDSDIPVRITKQINHPRNRITDGELVTMRTHQRLVRHIPEILSVWRANCEVTLVKSVQAIIKYVLKYCLKPEVASHSFEDIVKHLTENADDNDPVRKLFGRILLKTVGEHDLSLEECFTIISGAPYVVYTNEFAYVGLTERRRLNVTSNRDEADARQNNLSDRFWARHSDENFTKFCEFLADFTEELLQIEYPMVPDGDPNQLSLFEFAAYFTNAWQLRDKVAVPHPSPNFKYTPKVSNKKQRQTYCETTLLLHRPGCHPNNVTEGFDSAEEALRDFVDNNPRCPGQVADDYNDSVKIENEEVENDRVQNLIASQMSKAEDEEASQDSVMRALGRRIVHPTLDDEEPYTEDDTEEGDLNVETNCASVDWSADRLESGLSTEEIANVVGGWLDSQRKLVSVTEPEDTVINVDTLNTEQRRLFDHAKEVIDQSVAGGEPMQKLVDVCGAAGTGKSYVIRAIRQYAIGQTGKENSVRIAAPTGSAAALLPSGRTLHSLLHIRAEDSFREHEEPLVGNQLADIQEAFGDTIILIIDEKSMVGSGRLSQIMRRLRQARPDIEPDVLFGGLSVILVGDVRQLPPVADNAAFLPVKGMKVQNEGRDLFRQFNISVCLTESHRQKSDPAFGAQLERLAAGETTEADWDKWTERSYENLSAEDRATMDESAIKLCSTRAATADFNTRNLIRTGQPAVKIAAVNSDKEAAKADMKKAKNLASSVILSKDSLVVLTTNLWTEAKLCNGSTGHIKLVVFNENESASAGHRPAMVVVDFPAYIGPALFPDHPTWVPITAVTKNWWEKQKQMSRTQFPLMLGWSLTIHKSQGGSQLVCTPHDHYCRHDAEPCDHRHWQQGVLAR